MGTGAVQLDRPSGSDAACSGAVRENFVMCGFFFGATGFAGWKPDVSGDTTSAKGCVVGATLVWRGSAEFAFSPESGGTSRPLPLEEVSGELLGSRRNCSSFALSAANSGRRGFGGGRVEVQGRSGVAVFSTAFIWQPPSFLSASRFGRVRRPQAWRAGAPLLHNRPRTSDRQSACR